MKYVQIYESVKQEKEKEVSSLKTYLKKTIKPLVITTGIFVGLYLIYKHLENNAIKKIQDESEKIIDPTIILNEYDTKDAIKCINLINQLRNDIVKNKNLKLTDSEIKNLISETILEKLKLEKMTKFNIKEVDTLTKIISFFNKEIRKTKIAGAYTQFKSNDDIPDMEIGINYYGDLSDTFYNDKKFKNWINTTESVLVHEFVHYNQVISGRKNDTYDAIFPDLPEYFSNKGELEAHSIQTAHDLKKQGYNKNKFLNDLKKGIKFKTLGMMNIQKLFSPNSTVFKIFTKNVIKLLPD